MIIAGSESPLYTIPERITFKRWGAGGVLTARFRLRNGGDVAVGPVALRQVCFRLF